MADFTIPKSFFAGAERTNLLTTCHLAYFQMKSLFKADLHSMMNDVVLSLSDPERKEAFQKGKVEIETLSTPEDLFRLMRGPIGISQRDLLCRKGVEMGGSVADMIIDKLARNGNDRFIECAMLILSSAEEAYIDRVVKEFMSFRNAYARTQTTALLAFRNRTDALKDIYDFYCELAESSEIEAQKRADAVRFSIYLLTGHAEWFKEDMERLVGEGK